jgi:site-specific DNA-methyltransferase (adenine-specific)
MKTCTIIQEDCRQALKEYKEQADLILMSPPYSNARSKHYDSIAPDQFAEWFLTFHEVFWDALKEDGSLVINIKDKVVNGTRHRYVWQTILKFVEAGWHCIDDYIWVKPNPMPGYWPTRLRDGWEYCFHLAKTTKPYINQEAVRIPIGDWVSRSRKSESLEDKRYYSVTGSGFSRNRSKWAEKSLVLPSNVLYAPTVCNNKRHPAVFPLALPSFFIKLLSRKDSLVIDPFAGSGTTGVAALNLGRHALLIDNNPTYCQVARERVERESQRHPCQILLRTKEPCSIFSPTTSGDTRQYG